MCSWCYAFSRSWTALQKNLPGHIEVVYLLGGLAPDTTEPMPVVMQKTIQQAWQRIEQTVPDVNFNWEFWPRNTPVRSTYPACRAVLAARKQCADCDQQMVQAIQMAYYQQAKNPSLPETLLECANEIGLDVKIFAQDLKSAAIAQALQQEIQQARNMNVNSYPSLRLMHDNAVMPIRIDYRNHQTMLDEINHIVEKTQRP
ncbi:MAG: DsbA family protein [Nitrosomonas sp.]|nr:MAG: DsbA family protein [Nitrosomonas sp.]